MNAFMDSATDPQRDSRASKFREHLECMSMRKYIYCGGSFKRVKASVTQRFKHTFYLYDKRFRNLMDESFTTEHRSPIQ
jgi:hypothetical protein